MKITEAFKPVTPYLEKNCCIKHDKQKYCSHGSVITEKYILAYLGSKGKTITTWKGKLISDKVLLLSERQTIWETGYYLRFLYNNSVYSGFSIGKGGIIKARKTKLKTIFG